MAKAVLLIAVGLLLWVIGWYRLSGRVTLNSQIPSMNLAVVGVVLAGAGQASWFLAGRRAVGLRRRALLGSEPRPLPSVTGEERDGFVGGDRLYHRDACAMAAGRPWPAQLRGAHEAAGRVPCGVCRP
jgi:hypothetical protein